MANDDDSHISAFLMVFRRLRGLILKRFDISSKILTSHFHDPAPVRDDDDGPGPGVPGVPWVPGRGEGEIAIQFCKSLDLGRK